MRYLVQREHETRTSLLVEVVDSASSSVAATKSQMLRLGCAHALVIDSEETILLRDTFADMTESAIEVEDRIPSEQLFTGRGNLEFRVHQWLEAMSSNWRETLPNEAWTHKLMYDVVPAVTGSLVQRIDLDVA